MRNGSDRGEVLEQEQEWETDHMEKTYHNHCSGSAKSIGLKRERKWDAVPLLWEKGRIWENKRKELRDGNRLTIEFFSFEKAKMMGEQKQEGLRNQEGLTMSMEAWTRLVNTDVVWFPNMSWEWRSEMSSESWCESRLMRFMMRNDERCRKER